MFGLFDTLQSITWSLTYGLIIIFCFKCFDEGKSFFPVFAGTQTLGWEIIALHQSRGFIGHIVWLCLDSIIFVQNTIILGKRKVKFVYLYFIVFLISLLLLCLVSTLKAIDGLLVSSFVIDIIISLEYLVRIKKMSPHFRTTIGISRFLGDTFAWVAYAKKAPIILVFGGIVFILNILYIACSLELYSHNDSSSKGPRKRSPK